MQKTSVIKTLEIPEEVIREVVACIVSMRVIGECSIDEKQLRQIIDNCNDYWEKVVQSYRAGSVLQSLRDIDSYLCDL